MIEITAQYDPSSLGVDRDHYVFPAGYKRPYERAIYPAITGGIYFKKGQVIPETIVIHIKTGVDIAANVEEGASEE